MATKGDPVSDTILVLEDESTSEWRQKSVEAVSTLLMMLPEDEVRHITRMLFSRVVIASQFSTGAKKWKDKKAGKLDK